MYDFCFSPIYSVFLALAGAYIYFTTGSKASFGGAVGAAVILGGLAYGSLKYYIKHKAVCKPTVFLSLGRQRGIPALARASRRRSLRSGVESPRPPALLSRLRRQGSGRRGKLPAKHQPTLTDLQRLFRQSYPCLSAAQWSPLA